MNGPVQHPFLYDVEFDSDFGNLSSDRFEPPGNVPLYHSCVAHGHERGHVSNYIYEHRRTGAHRTEVVNAQQRWQDESLILRI